MDENKEIFNESTAAETEADDTSSEDPELKAVETDIETGNTDSESGDTDTEAVNKDYDLESFSENPDDFTADLDNDDENDFPEPPKKKKALQFTIIISLVIVLLVLCTAIVCRLFFSNGVLNTNLLGSQTETTWHYRPEAPADSTIDEAQIPDYYFIFEPDGKVKIRMGSFEYLGTYTIQNLEKQDVAGIEDGESKIGKPMLNIGNTGLVDGKFLFDREGNAFTGSTLTLTSLSSDLVSLKLDSKYYEPVKQERSGEFHKDDDLIGSWSFKNEIASQNFVFREDGTYDLKTNSSGAIQSQSGLYDCKDGKLTITVMAPDEQTQSFKYSIKDDKLSLIQIIEYLGQQYENPLNDFTRDKGSTE